MIKRYLVKQLIKAILINRQSAERAIKTGKTERLRAIRRAYSAQLEQLKIITTPTSNI